MTTAVFHVCSDYARQTLYGELLRAIAAPGTRQFMYVPTRTAAELDVGRITDDPAIAFRFQHLLRPYHRLLFRTKVRRVLSDVLSNTPVGEFRLVHAHFLYSDGAVARKLQKAHGLPYLVAVRNADLNTFMRYRPDLAAVRDDVLRHASRVVFLSPAYREAVVARLPTTLREMVLAKALVVPNGIGPDWLTEPPADPGRTAGPLRLLYVGDFTPNKNIAGIVAALQLVREQCEATLTVVGGGSDVDGAVQQLLERHAGHGVEALGRISDRQRLQALYRNHDILVMPSFQETFGLAYVEALSQGMPIVHSRGQGVDGYFAPDTVAAAVDPADPASIAVGIDKLAARLPGIRADCMRQARHFSWGQVGETYRETYRAILAEAA